jgi:hypothetical protein
VDVLSETEGTNVVPELSEANGADELAELTETFDGDTTAEVTSVILACRIFGRSPCTAILKKYRYFIFFDE